MGGFRRENEAALFVGVHEMKKQCLIFALVVFPPLGHFLGCYLVGWRIFPVYGFLFSALSMFVGSFVIATILVFTIAKRWLYRTLLFLPMVLIQFSLFWFVPPGATAEMIGTAHRLRTQFSPDQIRAAATLIQEKNSNGTLKTIPLPQNEQGLDPRVSTLVDESELPESLRGRFKYIGIARRNESDKPEIVFAFSLREGIVCNSNAFQKDFFHYSIGPYVHAYRYQRL